MHLSSSKSGVVLAPVSRAPDACQMATRAQLGQDPPPRTVLGVLTENVQYRTGQVTTPQRWEAAGGEGPCGRGGKRASLAVPPANAPGELQPWGRDCWDTAV